MSSHAANDEPCADGEVTQELWGGTWIGMSDAEVRSRYPAAHVPCFSATITGNWLQMKGPALADEPSTVTFYFQQRQLHSVRLAPTCKPAATRAHRCG